MSKPYHVDLISPGYNRWWLFGDVRTYAEYTSGAHNADPCCSLVFCVVQSARLCSELSTRVQIRPEIETVYIHTKDHFIPNPNPRLPSLIVFHVHFNDFPPSLPPSLPPSSLPPPSLSCYSEAGVSQSEELFEFLDVPAHVSPTLCLVILTPLLMKTLLIVNTNSSMSQLLAPPPNAREARGAPYILPRE